MKNLVVLIVVLLTNGQLIAHPDRGREETCAIEVSHKAKKFLLDHDALVSIYVENLQIGKHSLDLEGLRQVSCRDLDPGSLELRRERVFETKDKERITLYTMGDFHCLGEKILGIASIEAFN